MKRKTRQSVAAVENLEESGGDDEGAGGVEAVSEHSGPKLKSFARNFFFRGLNWCFN